MSWHEIGAESAKRENERLERQKLAYYSAQLVNNPIVEMHDTLKEIHVLLRDLLDEVRSQNKTL